jgi:hypothetical protein
MMLERTTRRILRDQLPMQFVKFGLIFSRKNSKGRICSVFKGRACQLYTRYHSFGSLVCERNPTWIAVPEPQRTLLSVKVVACLKARPKRLHVGDEQGSN